MKKLLSLALLVFLTFSCTPMVCPQEGSLRTIYSQERVPKSYSALLSVKYGPLQIPVFIKKNGASYEIRMAGSEPVSYRAQNSCIDSVCVDLPFSLDALLFGTVLRGDEKLTQCSINTLTFEKDDQIYSRRYIFSEGQLKRVEIWDRNGNRTLSINFSHRTREGYYRSLDIDVGGMRLRINVEEVNL